MGILSAFKWSSFHGTGRHGRLTLLWADVAAASQSSCPQGFAAEISLMLVVLCQHGQRWGLTGRGVSVIHSRSRTGWTGGVAPSHTDLGMVASWWALGHLWASDFHPAQSSGKAAMSLRCDRCFYPRCSFTASVTPSRRPSQFLTGLCFSWGLNTSAVDDALILIHMKCFPVTC